MTINIPDEYKYEFRTSDRWLHLSDNYECIIDPDGWDRSNFQFSFHEEKISYQEFMKRYNYSTITSGEKTYENIKDGDYIIVKDFDKDRVIFYAKKYYYMVADVFNNFSIDEDVENTIKFISNMVGNIYKIVEDKKGIKRLYSIYSSDNERAEIDLDCGIIVQKIKIIEQ